VPPLLTAIVVALHVPVATVPRVVIEVCPTYVAAISTTAEVVPVTVIRLAVPNIDVTGSAPLDAAVIRPLAFTVILAFVKEPTFEFTVANVVAKLPVPEPVTSPVSVMV